SYAEVLKLGSPRWSAAALTRIGQAHRSFNKGLLEAPVPRGLDAEEQDLYRQALESKALPLEDKAVEAFRKAIETGERSGAYTEWAIAAQDALRELQPDAYQDRRDTPSLRGDAQKAAARLAADRGRIRLAESLYARARTEDGSDPALPNELGILAAHRGDAAAARGFFIQATAVDPQFAPGWANLGALLLSYRDYR